MTPRPWELGVWNRHVFVHGGPNNDDIAEFNFCDEATVKITKEEAIANATLFCAAPDLLEALIEATVALQSLQDENSLDYERKAIVKSRNAISKATGEAP